MGENTHDCKHCEYSARTEEELNTHKLLKHPNEIEDSEAYKSELTPSEASTEVRTDKGEAFGYE